MPLVVDGTNITQLLAEGIERIYVEDSGGRTLVFGAAAVTRLLSQGNINGHGWVSVTPTWGQVEVGATVRVTAYPNDMWRLGFLRWNGNNLANGSTFTMPNSDVVITANFEADGIQIHYNVIGYDDLSPESYGWPTVAYTGDWITFLAPYIQGQSPSKVYIDGNELDPSYGNQGGTVYEFHISDDRDYYVTVIYGDIDYFPDDSYHRYEGYYTTGSMGLSWEIGLTHSSVGPWQVSDDRILEHLMEYSVPAQGSFSGMGGHFTIVSARAESSSSMGDIIFFMMKDDSGNFHEQEFDFWTIWNSVTHYESIN